MIHESVCVHIHVATHTCHVHVCMYHMYVCMCTCFTYMTCMILNTMTIFFEYTVSKIYQLGPGPLPCKIDRSHSTPHHHPPYQKWYH